MAVITRAWWGVLTLCLLVFMGSSDSTAHARTLHHAEVATLQDTLARAAPGDILNLAPGRYDHVVLRGISGRSDAPITLRSADPERPAVLHRLTLQDAKAIRFEKLRLEHEPVAASRQGARPFRVENSAGITFHDVDVVGVLVDRQDGPTLPSGIGLTATGTAGLRVEASRFHHLARGVSVSRSEDVLITDSRFWGLGQIGVQFAQIKGLTLRGNVFEDFLLPEDLNVLGTMIAGSTQGTTQPSTDIVIHDNLLTSGTGRWTQSILLRNEEVDRNRAGPELFFQDVTIKDNVIINAHINGIAVGPTRGLVISRNTVVRNAFSAAAAEDRGWHTPQILVADITRDALILGNVAHGLPDIAWQTDWITAANVLVQDAFPTEPNHYDAVFYGVTPDRPAQLADFASRPGGMLDARDVGAPRLIGLNPEARRAPRRETTALLEVMRFEPDLGGVLAFGGAGAPERLEKTLGRTIEIGRGHAPITLSAELTAPYFEAAEFDLFLRLRPALGYASKGEVLRIHDNLVLRITDRGVIEVDFRGMDAAQVRLRSKATRIYADEVIDIALRYDAKTGLLGVYGNGELIGQAQSNGTTRARESWGLSFGNPFGTRKSFDGTIEAFRLQVRQPRLDGVRAGLRP